MGRLASVFNETLGRLEGSFDQMRHFTADVSHELRTPLTAIRSVGEVGLRGHRDEAAYRGIIGSMLEEVDRLSQLVDRLLTLSRAGTHQAPFALERVDLAALAEDVVSHLGVLAEEKGQTLSIEQGRLAVGAGRPPRAAAGAHQPGGQRDQVHAAGGTDPAAPVRNAIDGRRRRDRHRAGRARRCTRPHLRSLLSRRWEQGERNRARAVAGPRRDRGDWRAPDARTVRLGGQHFPRHCAQEARIQNPDKPFRHSSEDRPGQTA